VPYRVEGELQGLQSNSRINRKQEVDNGAHWRVDKKEWFSEEKRVWKTFRNLRGGKEPRSKEKIHEGGSTAEGKKKGTIFQTSSTPKKRETSTEATSKRKGETIFKRGGLIMKKANTKEPEEKN